MGKKRNRRRGGRNWTDPYSDRKKISGETNRERERGRGVKLKDSELERKREGEREREREM